MKIEGYEEISMEEYMTFSDNEGINVFDNYTNKDYYFKKAHTSGGIKKFPCTFEDGKYAIEVNKEVMTITDKYRKWVLAFVKGMSAKILIKAVHKFEEINKKEEKQE